MDLLQNCPLFAVEAAREYVCEDVDVGKACDASSVDFIVLGRGEGTLLSWLELKRLALPAGSLLFELFLTM